VLEPVAYDRLDALGFRGLTISDAFDTPAVARHRRPALRALRAGLDLLLYGQKEAGAQRAFRRLVDDARAGRLSRRELRRDARRILAFKRRLATRAAR
jgi:beta-glucosidase-like glycosyl hydrolase